MMIMTFFNLISFTIFLNLTRCSSKEMETEQKNVSEVETEENQRKKDNLLSFSFEKNTLKNFKCNFDDKILSDESIKKKPFEYSKPIRNFISIFCFIFLYSHIISNEDFKTNIESLFEANLFFLHKINGEKNKFDYNPQTFSDQLQKINHLVSSFLGGKKTNMVSIKEKGDRIIITQNNNSSEDFNFHLVDSFLDVKCPTLENNEISDAMFEYSTKFYEVYLEGCLKEDFSFSLHNIFSFESNFKRYRIDIRGQEPEDVKKELNNLYSRFCQLVNIERQKESGYKSKFILSFRKYIDLLRAMHLFRKLPPSLSKLLLKSRAKLFYECSHDFSEIDIVFPFSAGSKHVKIALREILKSALKDTNKISYEGNSLSAESFENLVKNCLELVV